MSKQFGKPRQSPVAIDVDGGHKLGNVKRRQHRSWPIAWVEWHGLTMWNFLDWFQKEHHITPRNRIRWFWQTIARWLRTEDTTVNMDALRVFFWLADRMDLENVATIWTGEMQRDLDFPKQRLMRACRLLIDRGWVIRRRGKRHTIKTRFVINPELACKDHDGKAGAWRMWSIIERQVQENPNVG